MQKQLNKDLHQLRETRVQRIQIERQRIIHSTAKKVVNLTLIIVETDLGILFSFQGTDRLKQKELNDIHVRNTLPHLKRSYLK